MFILLHVISLHRPISYSTVLQQTRQGNSSGIGRFSLKKLLRKDLLVYEFMNYNRDANIMTTKNTNIKVKKTYVSKYPL